MSTWLYQYFIYAFRTARCWGRGPREWDASNLILFTNPITNQVLQANAVAPSFGPQYQIPLLDKVFTPSTLCHWGIHEWSLYQFRRKTLQSSPRTSRESTPDPFDENSWKAWPESSETANFHEKLSSSLSNNSFSNIAGNALPVLAAKMPDDAGTSENKILVEALGFSIMAHNSELVDNSMIALINLSEDDAEDIIKATDPLHLACTFLDGATSCCSVFVKLLERFWDEGPKLNHSDTDPLGHTVFDKLMISILKAHTKLTPGDVDDNWKGAERFPGEEVDICGRWDADSDCIRALWATGATCIPFAWKHKFCHTAVQTICHCLWLLNDCEGDLGTENMWKIPSALFARRCKHCACQMKLQPLHVIVIIAIHLAQNGTRDEDLFGMMAVLLCAVKSGADPSARATVSMRALFPTIDFDLPNDIECDHEKLSPGQLARRVPASCVEKWSPQVQTGWQLFCYILQRLEIIQDFEPPHPLRTCVRHGLFFPYLSVDRTLRTLLAAVETEVLTYRRREEGGRWVSPHFDMDTLLDGLKNEDQVLVDLVTRDMMNPVCECGWFSITQRTSHNENRAEQITKFHFSNLDYRSRSTILPQYDDIFM